MALTRRNFLVGAASAAGIAAAGLDAQAETTGASASVPHVEYATLLDIEKCIGCGQCVEGCHERNGSRYPKVKKPLPVMFPPGTKDEDWSGKRDVDDRLTPYNWLYIESVTVQKDGAPLELHIPRRCLHCTNPPCANLCPWGAASRQPETGTVSIDSQTCLGGAKCRTVCPWHIPQRQSGVGLYLDLMPRFAGNGIMYKCDRCADSFAHGQLPACVEVCPQQVQTIGPRDEILAQARKLAQERGAYLYGVTENGGTNTFYLSPVPFSELAAQAKPGPGKPTFAPVADSMAQAGNLTRMLMTAPLVGVAGALVNAARQGQTPSRNQAQARPQGALHDPKAEAALSGSVLKKLWVAVALLLGFTGMMQLPVASRYGIAKIPGLTWTGDFYTTLNVHYVLAALLLALGLYWLTLQVRGRLRGRLAYWGKVRLAVLGVVVLSGMARVAKNLPSITFSPGMTTFIDLVHLGFAVLLGVLCLWLRITGRGAWRVDG
ncbi:MAG TPA: 4Fe-4S dicluster domain-containing protein [Desulfovibrio sp.]|uniref:4Fe-4S dicluster domain-containing protein n=1 Tax=Desulfovibrio sp. TaxID=885 RepID=UPI002D5A96B4|nr:4Fe-4S dicluster domain-containing protein [Desulfovibrio sp.]HZF61481.1 4Fe-4S dicluster domain-containing protein [Desulfovibrio sp.]